ncbi:hypothetical protein CRUP_033114 [Coryphaenoides rupestris]|nr:hypothetical protein CRUP_033114 [Coryphaenoides rupestris]
MLDLLSRRMALVRIRDWLPLLSHRTPMGGPSENLSVGPSPLPALLQLKEASDVVGRNHLTGSRQASTVSFWSNRKPTPLASSFNRHAPAPSSSSISSHLRLHRSALTGAFWKGNEQARQTPAASPPFGVQVLQAYRAWRFTSESLPASTAEASFSSSSSSCSTSTRDTVVSSSSAVDICTDPPHHTRSIDRSTLSALFAPLHYCGVS